MKQHRWYASAPIGLIALAALLAPAAGVAAGHDDEDTVRGSFERTLQVSGPVQLEVKTGSGDIRVRSGESGRVAIHGKIQAQGDWRHEGRDDKSIEERVHYLEAHPPIEQDGNRIRVGPIPDRGLSRNISIDYEVEVPVETVLSAESGSGDLEVKGIKGQVTARSGSGDITLDSVDGAVQARTGSGDTKLQRVSGDQIEVETGSGDMDLRDVRCALRLRAGSGDIKVDGEPTGEWVLGTGAGEVSVRLASAIGFDLDAHTSSGEISTPLAITTQGRIGGGALQGKVRGGGVRVEVRTGSGDIHIE